MWVCSSCSGEVRCWNNFLEGGKLGADGLTCDDSSSEVDVDDAGGKGGQDHSQRGKEAAHHHHWTTAEAVYQHTAQRTWTKCNTLRQSGCVCLCGVVLLLV